MTAKIWYSSNAILVSPRTMAEFPGQQLYKCVFLLDLRSTLKELFNILRWVTRGAFFVDANHDLIHQRKVVLESNVCPP